MKGIESAAPVSADCLKKSRRVDFIVKTLLIGSDALGTMAPVGWSPVPQLFHSVVIS
jgi:hypothetical protein